MNLLFLFHRGGKQALENFSVWAFEDLSDFIQDSITSKQQNPYLNLDLFKAQWSNTLQYVLLSFQTSFSLAGLIDEILAPMSFNMTSCSYEPIMYMVLKLEIKELK